MRLEMVQIFQKKSSNAEGAGMSLMDAEVVF